MKRVNLLPPEFTRGKRAVTEAGTKQKMFFFTLLFIAMVAGHYGLQMWQLKTLNLELSERRLNLEAAETSSITLRQSQGRLAAQLENLEQKISLQGKKKSELRSLMQKEFKWSEALEAFNKSIPEKVWIDALVLGGAKSEILGGTYSTDLISKFITRLNTSPFLEMPLLLRQRQAN